MSQTVISAPSSEPPASSPAWRELHTQILEMKLCGNRSRKVDFGTFIFKSYSKFAAPRLAVSSYWVTFQRASGQSGNHLLTDSLVYAWSHSFSDLRFSFSRWKIASKTYLLKGNIPLNWYLKVSLANGHLGIFLTQLKTETQFYQILTHHSVRTTCWVRMLRTLKRSKSRAEAGTEGRTADSICLSLREFLVLKLEKFWSNQNRLATLSFIV